MATYHWVGGSGTWDNANTTNWSASSGGAGGSGPPNNADTVNFDSNSGTAAVVTVASTAAANTVVINKSDINLSLSANANLNGPTSGSLTLTAGVLTLNSYTLTLRLLISSNTNARTLDFGTGKIILTANSNTIWSCATVTGLVVSGTPIVDCTYSGATGTRTISHGNSAGQAETNVVSFNFTAGTDTIALTNVKSVNFTGFAGTLTNAGIRVYGNLNYSTGMTLTAGANATNFNATSGIQQVTTNGKTLDHPITQNSPGATVQLQDNLTMGSTRTFTLTAGALDLTGNSGNWTLSTGVFASANSNTRSIAFGSGNITLTGNNTTIWNMLTSTGFTYSGTPTVNATYSGSSGTRNISTSGIIESNAVDINVIAGTDIVGVASFRNIDFTGFAGTLSNSTRNVFGNLTFSSGMTVSAGTLVTNFAATSGTKQITTNGKTIDFPLTFNGIGGTFAFQDALTQGSTRAFTITNGTVRLRNGVTSTVGSFVANNASVKFLQSTTPGSQATLSQASGTVNVADLTIRDINAVGGAAWNAYTDFENTDAGNNDGWNFSLSPPYTTAELPITLRSFTQPRRF